MNDDPTGSYVQNLTASGVAIFLMMENGGSDKKMEADAVEDKTRELSSIDETHVKDRTRLKWRLCLEVICVPGGEAFGG